MYKDDCNRIVKMLDDLKSIGANTSKFESELDDFSLRLLKYKVSYERNEIN